MPICNVPYQCAQDSKYLYSLRCALNVHCQCTLAMYITNVQYVAYNAMLTMHIEMQIKTAFVLKHFGSTLVMYIAEVHYIVH